MTRGALLIAVLVALAAPARADRLVLSLSANQITIGANYTGAQLVAFGVIERDPGGGARTGRTDVVVTVRGPRENLNVRRKEPFGPMWLNRGRARFVAVPAVLGVYSSSKLADIADPATLGRLRLGTRAIVDAPELSVQTRLRTDPYRAALIRLKTGEGLWRENERGVTFVTADFFRAPLPIPATAPIGNYDVEAVVLSGGAVVARREASFEVIKAGFEEQVTTFAQDRGLLYGLGIAAMSLFFGWLASVIFRRD